MLECYEKYKNLLITIMIVSAVFLILNIISAISGTIYLGFSVTILFPAVMCVLLYFSIITYTNDYFFKGKDSSIMGLLMRFCATVAAFLIGLTDKNTIIVAIIAFILILVPLIVGDPSKIKRSLTIMAIVMVLTIALDVGKIILIPKEVLPYQTKTILDSIVYYAIAFNQVAQWLMFCILYIVRGKGLTGENK